MCLLALCYLLLVTTQAKVSSSAYLEGGGGWGGSSHLFAASRPRLSPTLRLSVMRAATSDAWRAVPTTKREKKNAGHRQNCRRLPAQQPGPASVKAALSGLHFHTRPEKV